MEITEINTVVEREDNYSLNGTLCVPKDPGNRDYQSILEWIAKGNTPTPEPPVVAPVFIDEVALLKEKVALLESKLTTVETKVTTLGATAVVSDPISTK